MASAKLSTKAVGSIIKLNLNGSPRNLRILHQGKPSSLYDDSCDGTWVCLEDLYSTRTWDGSNNDYKNSDIHAWLNNDFLKLFDPDIQAAIKQVKIPYVNGTGGSAVASGANGLSCKIFLLSGYELGWTKSDNSYFPVDGAKLDYFTAGTSSAANQKRIAKYNGSATYWWTRSPSMSSSGSVWSVGSDGNCGRWNYGNTYGVRPAFVLPSTLLVSDDGTVSTNEPPTAPGSIDVSGVVSGGTATITLTAVTDPDGTVESYRYERSVDGGDFAQFADVNSLTQTDPIDESWGTIAYRACAVDDAGEAGPYVTSEAETINSGWLLIGGPANNLGITAEPFIFAVTIGVSGQSGVQDIHVTVTVDDTVAFDDMANQGDKVSVTVDVRTFGAGQHGIQVLAEKEDYLAAVSSYTFKVPSFALPAGGRTQFLKGPDGETVLPITSSRNVIGPHGLDIQTEVDNIVKAGRGSTGHLEFVDTILGPKSYELARKENTAYTVQLFATASSPSGSSLACVYAGYTGQVGTYLNAEAEKLTFTVPANAILSIYKFVLDAPLTAEKDPTVNFTALDQPRVLSAATNAGTAATDLNDALNQIMEAFPSWNYYMMTSADGTVTYYIACADGIADNTASVTGAYVSSAEPTKWYQGVQVNFFNKAWAPDSATLTLGNTISWAGKSWIVSHTTESEAYLTLAYIYSQTPYDAGESAVYAGSDLANTAMDFQTQQLTAAQLACLKDVTVNGVTAKVFVASKDQMTGGFAWFNINSRRTLGNRYWTSTPYDEIDAYYINTDGSLAWGHGGLALVTTSNGFRPSVCLDLTLLS